MTKPQHGELVRPGDEFNLESWYMCGYCSTVHALDYSGCDGLRRSFLTKPAAAPKHNPQGVKMTAQWTQADEARFNEMAARRDLVMGFRRDKLTRVVKRFPVDGIVDHMINHLIANADEVRDALAPFDSGVRPLSGSEDMQGGGS